MSLAPYFLGTLYPQLDHFTLDLQHSWGRFQVETFVHVAFLQIWLWEHFRNYAHVPRVLSSHKTSRLSPQGLPRFWHWNKMAVSSNSFLSKVLDDPTDWTTRPRSVLEGGLPPLFTTLESVLFFVTDILIGLKKNFLLLLVLFLLTFRHTFKMSMKLKPTISIGSLTNLVLTKAY